MIEDRIMAFELLFDALQSTTSRVEKEQLIKVFKRDEPELIDDLTYILETLDNKHPIGWTFTPYSNIPLREWKSIREIIQACERVENRTIPVICEMQADIGSYGDFIAPIVNRTLRLGIGKSLLEKSELTPMLAKKFESHTLLNDVVVTEKLDGNRCIAHYNGEKWCFTSRSGKPLLVFFDMTGMNTDYIYDGEIMSTVQTVLSIQRHDIVWNNLPTNVLKYDLSKSQLLFNETSGLINQKGQKSGLVYNIFDIICNKPYYERRRILQEEIDTTSAADVRILPVLYVGREISRVDSLLDIIVQTGGEGLMLNRERGLYQHKRTDELLKYKQVQFMDMRVLGVAPGSGKYEGLVGALVCDIDTADGKHIYCSVGSGLSDVQREEWAYDDSPIVGKIVQVGYHELTQDRDMVGTKHYSLRFPRLIKVRGDKNETSEY